MRDRIVLPLMLLAGLAMAALATVWPQGHGRPSPAPFGHPEATAAEQISVDGKMVTGVRGAEQPDPAGPKARAPRSPS